MRSEYLKVQSALAARLLDKGTAEKDIAVTGDVQPTNPEFIGKRQLGALCGLDLERNWTVQGRGGTLVSTHRFSVGA